MIEILGKKYITEKEASSRYGYSMAWFQKKRYLHEKPSFTKINSDKRGRIYYCLGETDKWFNHQLEKNSL